jgi:hypothetical protein
MAFRQRREAAEGRVGGPVEAKALVSPGHLRLDHPFPAQDPGDGVPCGPERFLVRLCGGGNAGGNIVEDIEVVGNAEAGLAAINDGPPGDVALGVAVRGKDAIAACHARARSPEETDWVHIARLYAELAQLAPSPVVELNRAVAVAMAFGPQAGLALVDALTAEPSLEGYHLLPSVRGDLLFKLGRFDEARGEFERAAALTRNARQRTLLLERARACAGGATPPEPR